MTDEQNTLQLQCHPGGVALGRKVSTHVRTWSLHDTPYNIRMAGMLPLADPAFLCGGPVEDPTFSSFRADYRLKTTFFWKYVAEHPTFF